MLTHVTSIYQKRFQKSNQQQTIPHLAMCEARCVPPHLRHALLYWAPMASLFTIKPWIGGRENIQQSHRFDNLFFFECSGFRFIIFCIKQFWESNHPLGEDGIWNLYGYWVGDNGKWMEIGGILVYKAPFETRKLGIWVIWIQPFFGGTKIFKHILGWRFNRKLLRGSWYMFPI